MHKAFVGDSGAERPDASEFMKISVGKSNVNLQFLDCSNGIFAIFSIFSKIYRIFRGDMANNSENYGDLHL